MQDEAQLFVDHLQSSSALTFARSLFHAAEGKELFDQGLVFPSAVSTYYSVFHLGMALMLAYYSCPVPTDDPNASTRNRLKEKWSKRQPRALSNGKQYVQDLAQTISHGDVPLFLKRKLPEIAQSLDDRDALGTLRDMREFVSYAPRILSDGPINILYSGCQYTAQDFKSRLKEHLDRIDEFFHSSVQWMSQKGYNEIRLRLLSGDFILFEFAELRQYRPESVVKRAWAMYRSVCEQEGVDWRVYRCAPGIFHTDQHAQQQRYTEVVHSFS